MRRTWTLIAPMALTLSLLVGCPSEPAAPKAPEAPAADGAATPAAPAGEAPAAEAPKEGAPAGETPAGEAPTGDAAANAEEKKDEGGGGDLLPSPDFNLKAPELKAPEGERKGIIPGNSEDKPKLLDVDLKKGQ